MPNLIQIIQQICAIILSNILKTQLLLVRINLSQISREILSIMKRYMKQSRINFFQSPHPRNIDFNNLRENRYHFSEDAENLEERLFLTPLRCPAPPSYSPYVNIDPYFTQNPTTSRKPSSQDLSVLNSEAMENQQQQEMSASGINQKVEYSEEEELLLPLTPEKIQIVEEENQNTATAKKNCSYQNSAMSESKFYERGLKKLAYEAFQFVSQQKKTTYKEVAKKLISQINDENEFDVHKKGEMNIKRRVYDALNVLIALGLLKRNGNKILGKRISDSQTIFLQKQAQKQNQRKKEEILEDELRTLRSDFEAKAELLKQKQGIMNSLKQKIMKMKEITQKNQRDTLKMSQESKRAGRKQSIIQFPFFAVCLAEKSSSLQQPLNTNLVITKENFENIQLSFNSQYDLQLLGDLDLIQDLNLSSVQTQSYEKPEKSKKSKRR